LAQGVRACPSSAYHEARPRQLKNPRPAMRRPGISCGYYPIALTSSPPRPRPARR
jgi:hypothetical protein